MTTATRSISTTPRHDVGFGGVVRSEALKLLSIRSTLWAYAVFAVITIGVTAQVSAATNFAWFDGEVSQAGMQAAAVDVVANSTVINVLVIGVLGVLVIAGEYSTGMIRSTFTAVPRRVPVLLAKYLVFGVVTTLVGLLALAIAIPISWGLLAGNDIHVQLNDPDYWRAAIGSVVYLTAVGLIALGIGTVFRSIVSGVTVTLGFLFVLPLALGLVGSALESQTWLRNIALVLPFNLGVALTTHPGWPEFASPGVPVEIEPGEWVLEPWHGALGLAVWVIALLVAAIALVKRRDV
jgi:ABC-2 type transport system permease protein